MPKETIGPKIKNLRKKKKLTQEELAHSLGYSGRSVISHIEHGDADMTYEKILLLLKTYMLDANEFFEVESINKRIEDWKLEQRRKKKVVVYIHGLHGSSQEAEDFYFFDAEYDVVGLAYPDGNPWELKETIQSEFEKLTKDYKAVIVIANSIGAFYAYEYLSGYDIDHAFFIAPIASMSQIIFNTMMSERISERELEEKKFVTCADGTVLSFDFYRYISNHKDDWKAPTDILYGSRDELVYIENIADFLAAHPSAKLTIKEGAGHHFHTPEEKAFIKDWILHSVY